MMVSDIYILGFCHQVIKANELKDKVVLIYHGFFVIF